MPHAATSPMALRCRPCFGRDLVVPERPNNVVRELSAFIWTALELAGSQALRDAGAALYPIEPEDTVPEDELRDMLLAAAAALCQFAAPCASGNAVATGTACGLGAADLLQSAHRLIAALEQSSRAELDEARAYFSAPPWGREVAARQPALAELGFGIAQFMIECAAERAA